MVGEECSRNTKGLAPMYKMGSSRVQTQTVCRGSWSGWPDADRERSGELGVEEWVSGCPLTLRVVSGLSHCEGVLLLTFCETVREKVRCVRAPAAVSGVASSAVRIVLRPMIVGCATPYTSRGASALRKFGPPCNDRSRC